MSARERLPNQRLSESFGVEYALDVRQAPQASCQRQELITTGEQHRCTPPRPDAKLAVYTHQFGSRALYRWGDALLWAKGRLSAPQCSTSEGDVPPTPRRLRSRLIKVATPEGATP
jgi:hypothetical protein